MKSARYWGAPVAAVVFFYLWCVAEAGRMGPWPGLPMWSGSIPLVLATLAIAVSVRLPYVSLGATAVLLLGQLVHAIPAMYANHWAIYLGSFIALGFTLWTARPKVRMVAGIANLVFAAVMAFLMVSWRYGGGVGWFPPTYFGDRGQLPKYGWTAFAVLVMVAGACAAVGLLLALYQERGSLFRDRILAQSNLKEAEIELIVEQERTRISRDLHDSLAHSLAVIAAQADGSRYLSTGQPKAVLDALDTIATSARSALVDAQRVIEGVGGGMAAPQPRFSDVMPLIERMRQGSLKIEHSESGGPVELSPGQQLAVFRIVQECLTNALKHGGRGTFVRAHFDWSGPGLTIHLASDLPSSRDTAQDDDDGGRVGRGIPGMRERAHLAGGWLTSGPDGEQFRVTAFLPYGTRAGTAELEPALAAGAQAAAKVSSVVAASTGLQPRAAIEGPVGSGRG
ncbi:sensor histidine kinase [Arthrobacter sp. 35W]|uniref:sensor histidine kinase n=1 Tax=Arthrobacter sp. 35W TaxID=1132441 RepID=UPI0009DF2298|nr:histidine kinase [Arthrobacter sp. 35W]